MVQGIEEGSVSVPFGPDRAEVPELIHLSRAALLVQSFEAFAMEEPGGERRALELVTFSGRYNKTEETTTLSVVLVEENLVALIDGLQKGLRVIQARAS